VAREDPAFPWFIGGALAIALAGGFVLALLLPLAAALDWGWGVRWRALAQAHGHLQMTGWLGLFIAGMAFRLAPRFAGRPLAFSWATAPTLVLLLAGITGRALAQPLLDVAGMRALLVVSAVAELAGALLLAAALVRTLAPALRSVPSASLFLLGGLGLFVQAALGVLWLPDLTADMPFVRADRNAALLAVQVYAFVLPFIFGVSWRALPSFFAYRTPSPAWALVLVTGLAVGTALLAVGPLIDDITAAARVQGAGSLVLGAAIAGGIAGTGVWRKPERLRASARHAALLIRTAYVWLALVALALVWTGGQALADGLPVPPADADAIRHALALGVFTTLLVGMASLMLPWLAMRRQRPGSARWETRILWALLTAATVLRVAGAVLEREGTGSGRYHLMALGGVLAIVAIAYFASTVLRAVRQPPPEIVLQERKVQ
jgi:uncharacterized protein involved in response to NO